MMPNKGVFIKYGDIAAGARENFSPSSDDKSYFTDFSDFKENVEFPKYTNPCELYSTSLDGSCLLLPQNTETVGVGWWSEQLSGDYGIFANPIVLTLNSAYYFSSKGITLIFDENNDVYANNVKIKWYGENKLLSEKDFAPDDAIYFCSNDVDFYNKLEITFYSINMPKNRLKLHSIEYGFGAEFTSSEMKSVKMIQEVDPLTTEISVNTCDFELTSKRDIEYSFQERQPIEIYFNGKLRGKSFIKNFTRKTKTQWSVKTEDYIGLLETVPFVGGIYENEIATNLLKNIFDTAKVPYTIQEGQFDGIRLSGYIPFTNCREALMQVAFAMGATVDTSNRQDVYLYVLSDNLTQTIPRGRILQGQSFSNETRMTAFELTAHQYIPIEDEKKLYEAEKSGVGDNIFVEFSEPIQSSSLRIISGDGEIIERGTNYAIINAGEGCVLQGKTYEHKEFIKRKTNPIILVTDTENVVSIKDATLVSKNNVDNLLIRCYNYYINSRTVNLKIVENKHKVVGDAVKYGDKKYGTFKYGKRSILTVYDTPVNVGDLIETETEYLGNIQGRVIKQSFNLNGGIITKDTVMREQKYDI